MKSVRQVLANENVVFIFIRFVFFIDDANVIYIRNVFNTLLLKKAKIVSNIGYNSMMKAITDVLTV